MRQVTLHHAGRLVEPAPPPRTRLRTHGLAHIVAEADGTMLPIVDTSATPAGSDKRRHRHVRWQEARVVAAQAHGETTAHYDTTLGDGAPWLAQQAATRFGPTGTYLLNLYRVCDYLAAVWARRPSHAPSPP